MNPPVVRIFGVVLVLFGILVFATSWWTVFGAEGLRDNPNNRRALLEEQRIKRGRILAADRRTLARPVPAPNDTWTRRWPTGRLFAHSVGYSYTSFGRAGLERYYNDQLIGRRTELVSVVDSLLGSDDVGDDLQTTLDPRAQQVAVDALNGRKGAVVALDVKSGRVLVMASEPSFDPNDLDVGRTFQRLSTDDENSPLLNRATQGTYPPGSTMKTVTATAALDSGKYSPQSRVSGKNGKVISGVPLNNFGSEDFGDIDLTTALTNSVNTVWAEVGVKVGRRTMTEYMRRYGFFTDPPADYPGDQMVPSGVHVGRRTNLTPSNPRVDVGRVAIGQGGLEVTPLQMASVAQTIANGGVRMEPRLGRRVIDPDGRTVDDIGPAQAERVMSEKSASELTAMMKQVVKEGTGTAAALEGVEVAGKTGTAELDIARRINQPWFIGFTSRVAVAVTVERVQAGTGGVVAAPIAKKVLESLGSRR
jgi:peptidoglycan glycosyltransferase